MRVREGTCLGPYWLEACAAYLQRVEGAILLCRAWLGSGSGLGSGLGFGYGFGVGLGLGLRLALGFGSG